MTRSLLTLIVTFCLTGGPAVRTSKASAVAKASANRPAAQPAPSRPTARSACCEIRFDASGRFEDARMTRSTGAKVLDDAMVDYARELYAGGGPPRLSLQLPITCKSVESETRRGKSVLLVAGPSPPYPGAARVRRIQGSGIVKLSFDVQGRTSSAVMVQSTGSRILDESALKFMRSTWKSSGGAAASVVIPVSYRFR